LIEEGKNQERKKKEETTLCAKTRAPEYPVLDRIAKEIHERHPQRRRNCGVGAVKTKLKAILQKLPRAEWDSKLNQINENHRGWCKSWDWQKEGGEFARALANWLAPTEGRFDGAPPAAPGSYPRLMLTDDGVRSES
jgi:hypothetical protein